MTCLISPKIIYDAPDYVSAKAKNISFCGNSAEKNRQLPMTLNYLDALANQNAVMIKKTPLNVQRLTGRNLFQHKYNKDVEFISINKNNEQQTQDSRFVPIRLKPNEAKKAHECQKVMLKFMKMQYEQSIGTKKEDTMRKMYNDAIVDFKEFEAQYKDELST